MTPSRISWTLLGCFACTVFALQWWQQPLYPALLWVVISAVIIVSATGTLLHFRSCGYAAAAAAGIALACTAVAHSTHITDTNSAEFYAGRNITVTGTVTAEPDRRPMQTKYTVAVDTLVTGSGTLMTGMRSTVLVNDGGRYTRPAFGDRIEVRGDLKLPEPVDDFRYDNYLSRYGIYGVMSARSLRFAGDVCTPLSAGMRARRVLYGWKETVENTINVLLPEPHASFMAGLLTGSRKGIPDDLMEDFATTGLTHIIAISGYNITIITTIIMGALFWLPHRFRLLPAAGAIAAFTVFVGASAAVVRAAVMGTLGLLAMHYGRTRDMRLTLLWTLAIMVAWNPKYLWYDAGFQLSFLSVLGLMELSPWLGRHLQRVPETLGMRESLQATIAAQIATLPLTVVLFGRLSLIAPLANILAAPVIPLAMLLGTLGVFTGMLHETAGRLMMTGAWLCLTWIMEMTGLLARLPLASVTLL